MSQLKLNITMSIDGFVAGPDQSPEHPLGIGGEALHDWLVPLKAPVWNNTGDVVYLRKPDGTFIDTMTVGDPARHPNGH